MSITRRGFLKGVAGILAASQAPAILARENVMDIYVPPEKKIVVASVIPGTSAPTFDMGADALAWAADRADEIEKAASWFEIRGLREQTRVSILGEKNMVLYHNQVANGSSRIDLANIVGEPVEIKLSAPGYKDESHFTRIMGDGQKLVVNQTCSDAETYDASSDLKLAEPRAIYRGDFFKI